MYSKFWELLGLFEKKLISSSGIIQVDLEVQPKLDTGTIHSEITSLMSVHFNFNIWEVNFFGMSLQMSITDVV